MFRIRRWVFLGLVALSPSLLPAAEPQRVNVILILVDDLGWSDLSCQGSHFYQTPEIDRLARQGIRFTHAYAASPVCSPSRAAILTGRHPARLHLTDWLPGRPDQTSQKLKRPIIRQALPLEEETIAELLRGAGYATGHIGKWHLGGPGYWPEQQGFDLNVGGSQAGSPPGGYFHFKAPKLIPRSDHEYLTDRLGDEAVAFIESHAGEPFFLYLAHYAVHIPLAARPDLQQRFKARTSDSATQYNAIYGAMIASVDESVGKVRKTLERLKIYDKTVIIFTTDNGGLSVKEGPHTPATSNAPLRAGKGYLYEGGIRVPLIINGPGVIPAGMETDVPVSGLDLLPTILDIAGVCPPGHELDGESLMPIFRRTGRLARSSLLWHYPHYSNQGGKPGGAIRSGNWKLIEWYEDQKVELYDVTSDPGEQRDRSSDQPELVRRLRSDLALWRRQVAAQMPMPKPDYKPRSSVR